MYILSCWYLFKGLATMSPVARKHVYSVCGHTRYTDEECPPNCESKTPLMRLFKFRFGKGGIPTRPETLYMMGFCHDCRSFYDFAGRTYFDLKTVILRYWAFKSWQDISEPIPASRVPLQILFGKPPPHIEAQIQAFMDHRLEILMLFDQMACVPERPMEETLMRLERVRSATLKWATRGPAPFRPGQSHILNNITKPEEDIPIFRGPQAHDITLSALCGQAHTATLSALCGEEEPHVERLDIETWEKIKAAWIPADRRRSTIAPKPEQVSRWSINTTCAPIHPEDQSEELLQPVCFQGEILRPVCYQPGRQEGNWI